jgi:DNA-binding MarR family transcriptional regulator
LRNLPTAGANVSVLAARAGMTKQSMSYLVEQMRAAGLVCVAPDRSDQRANIVKLTSRGANAVAAAVDLSKQYEARLAGQIGARKVAQLRGLLSELYAKLETSE